MRSLIFRNWVRGLGLLRYSELIAWLGREQSRLSLLRQLECSAKAVRIADSAQLVGWSAELFQLNEGVSIGAGSIFAFGDHQNGKSRICIGRQTWIGEYNNLRSGAGEIQIGQHCMVSQFVSIIGSGHGLEPGTPMMLQGPPSQKRGVTIGDDVWIGAGATVLPGVDIGDGVVVGAGAVVNRNVAAGSIVAGVPARVIGRRGE